MPEQGDKNGNDENGNDENGNGFPTEQETKSLPGSDEKEERGNDPERPEDDEGFPTAPEA
jgi:hypothetical protein